MSEQHAPYVILGRQLKYVREQSRQTLAEASGAVEIDEPTLERIESGVERPAEDILLLLISHFGVEDQEAVRLWQLANYETDLPDQLHASNDQSNTKPMVMLLALDVRTMYSDGLEVTQTKAGVTLSFTQSSSKTSQAGDHEAIPIARIGMSYDQALIVLDNLRSSLLKSQQLRQPKLLTESNDSSQPTNQSTDQAEDPDIESKAL